MKREFIVLEKEELLSFLRNNLTRVIDFEAPMANLLTDFYDQLKSSTSGYASFNYELGGWTVPWGFRSDSKESACNVGDLDSIPGLGRSLGEGNGNSLQYSSLENPMDSGAWWLQSMGSQRVADKTERLALSLFSY